MERILKFISQNYPNDLIHLSEYKINNIKQCQHQPIAWKPNHSCLYLSKGAEWIDWCINSDYNLEKYKYIYRFEIDTTNYIILKNYDDVKKFTHQYQSNNDEIIYNINWEKVSNEYSGFIIQNYYHIMNDYNHDNYGMFINRNFWIISWDIDTIVVFNPESVKKFELVYSIKK